MTTSTSSAAATGLPDRRHFISSAAGASALALTALSAGLPKFGDTPDAALLALRAPWLATLANFNAALTAKSRIDEQVFAASASYPDYKTWTGSIAEFSAATEAITAEREAADAKLGGEAADQLVSDTSDANGDVVEQIETTPARTLAGLAFKVEVSEEQCHGREELIDSIMADIKALAAGGLHA